MALACGICGESGKLTRTECCGKPICDDEDEYVMFSYARNSCHRNHHRFTLCAVHAGEAHAGHWTECAACREMFETEMYVWYGTNEYNYEVLDNPPGFEPTRCTDCGEIIALAEGGYAITKKGKTCDQCYPVEVPSFVE